MASSSSYLATDNLHFKPLSARLLRGTTWVTTALQNNVSRTEWHGHTVIAISKVVLVAGAVICIGIALTECVSSSVIGGVGILLNKFLYQYGSEFLQKHSVKALSYGTHSLFVTIVSFALALKTPNLPFHTANSLGDHILHLASAALTQVVVGSLSDQAAGRSTEHTALRTFNLLGDGHPHILNDLLAHFQRDMDVNLSERLSEIPQAAAYLNRHPEVRDFIGDFSLRRFATDSAYRQEAIGFVRDFLTEIRLVRPNGVDPNLLELNHSDAAETAYQDRLANLLKTSFLEIYRTPHLARYLDKGEDSGQDLLEMVDASTYMPLTAYTQYKELLEPIQCPALFSNTLARYNHRHGQLAAAKHRVDALSAAQRRDLEQKILRGADFAAEGDVQEAYLAISSLAAALNQGPLMTKTAINLRNLNGRDMANLVEARNLFQNACQEALAEIEAAAAPRPPG